MAIWGRLRCLTMRPPCLQKSWPAERKWCFFFSCKSVHDGLRRSKQLVHYHLHLCVGRREVGRSAPKNVIADIGTFCELLSDYILFNRWSSVELDFLVSVSKTRGKESIGK